MFKKMSVLLTLCLVISMVCGFPIVTHAATVTPYPGMIITANVTFTPGTYDFSSGNGITVGAGNITIDGNGAILVGPGTAGTPSSFVGTALSSDGYNGVTIKNLTAKGFLKGLKVKNGSGWTIQNNNFSDNFTDPSYGWGDPYTGGTGAGAIVLDHVTGSTITGNTGNNVWDGLYMYYSDNNNVTNNHFSPCSNTCLKMWHSSSNTIDGNTMSYGIRCDPGETHARDSTSVLMETGSDNNNIRNNDFTHGGDGVFIRPLNGWLCKGNYFYNNDASYAHNNAWECWSSGNTFDSNKGNHSSYGFWLGGSDHTVLINNEAAYNGIENANAPEDFGNAGIAVVNGSSSHFICEGNNIHDNGDATHSVSGLAIRYNADYPAYHWIIQKNTITNNTRYGLYYKNAKWLDMAANTISGSGVANIYNGGNTSDIFNRTASMTDVVPNAIATVSANTVFVGTSITFNASASTDPNNQPLSYRWDLGDGTIAETASVTHAYTTPGFKRVGVTVNNGKLADLTWFDIYVVDSNAEYGTEGSASTWSSRTDWTQDHVWLYDDTTKKIKGTGSIKMVTDAGGPMYWNFPSGKNANWNLSNYNEVSLWMSSLNENSGGYQIATPTVRLCKDASNYFQYTPVKGLGNPPYSEGRDGWTYLQVPFLGDSNWTRTVTGSPSLSQINYIEFSADTWGAGFTIWTDGLGFGGTTAQPSSPNIALNTAKTGYPTPTASYTFSGDTVWGPLDGSTASSPRWTCWNSMNTTDWFAVDFGSNKAFGKIKAYFFDDGGGVKPPLSYNIQYWNGSAWVDAANQKKTPTTPSAGWNTITFTPVSASRVRIVCTNQNPISFGVYSGLTEFEVYNQFADDFTGTSTTGWTTYGGTWAVESNEYSVNSGLGYKSIANGTNFANFTYEADVKVSSNSSGSNAGLLFRVSNPSVGYDAYNGYYVGIYAADDRVVLGKANGSWTQITQTSMTINPDTFYHVKVTASSSSINIYVTDMNTPKISSTDTTYTTGSIGVRTWNTHTHFDNINVSAN